MESTDGIFLAQPDAPAAGIPLAVKDLFDTAGLTTTYGSSIFADHVPAETAEAVRLLEAAGYANVGKTNLHEFAYGVTSMNPHSQWVRRMRRRIAGGSSGGSAVALAAGLADAAIGTDSGGSIRIPAAYCGVVGFKPSYGLVSLEGCWPLSPSYDHAGPMARTVGECIAMLQVLAPAFVPQPPPVLGDLRVAVAWTEDADEGVRQRVEAAAARFPHRERIDFPTGRGNLRVFMREIADVHATLFGEEPEAYGEDVARKMRECLAVTDAEFAEAERVRTSFRDEAAQALEELRPAPDSNSGIRCSYLRGRGRRLAPSRDHQVHESVQRARLARTRPTAPRDGRARAPRVGAAGGPSRRRRAGAGGRFGAGAQVPA